MAIRSGEPHAISRRAMLHVIAPHAKKERRDDGAVIDTRRYEAQRYEEAAEIAARRARRYDDAIHMSGVRVARERDPGAIAMR